MRIRIPAVLGVLLATSCGNEGDIRVRTNTDTWKQAPNNEVDILWVVDDSCSMGEEQESLAGGFVSFVSEMEASGTDFQIGLITTSFQSSNPERGHLLGEPSVLSGQDDFITLFQERALVGIGGSDKEKGLEAAVYSLSPTMTLPGGPNEGFLRSSAHLLLVFVSDEEDCSDYGALEGQPAEDCYTERELLVPVVELVSDLQALKGHDSNLKVQVGAIVGLDDGACQDAYPGRRYQEAAALTGGLVGDICSRDWSNLLTDLGLNASGIQMSFQTEYLPREGTVEVFVDDRKIKENGTNGWTFDYTTWFLTFHGDAIPQRGAQIRAEYEIQCGTCEPGSEA